MQPNMECPRRRRMILLASRRNSVKFATERHARLTVRDAIDSLPEPGNSGDAIHDLPETRTQRMRDE